MKLARTLTVAWSSHKLRWPAGGLLVAVVLLLLCVPIPNRKFAAGWLEPRATQGVFASQTARLGQCLVVVGQLVEPGQALFQLESVDIQVQQIALRHALAKAQTRKLHAMHAIDSRLDDGNPDVNAMSLEPSQELIEQTAALLAHSTSRIDALRLVAPTAGRLVACRAPAASGPSAGEWIDNAANWCDLRQQGRTVQQGTLLAAICSANMQAVVVLDKSQLADVAEGTPVRLRVTGGNGAVIHSHVLSIVELEQRDLMWRPQVAADSADPGAQAATKFAAVVDLPESLRCLPGTSLDAIFVGRRTSVATLLYRWARSNIILLAD